MVKYDGGPAFPVTLEQLRQTCEGYGNMMGMSLRDYFAATNLMAGGFVNMDCRSIASICYEIADAMLEEREKQ